MSANTRYDAIVVGVGAMGSATCSQLARRGARVLGLEQFGIPHSLGSSHGESRMIRLCYYEHPDYVPLLHRAYQLWDELEKATGSHLLFKTGGIYMGDANSEFIRGTLRAAREHQLPHEELSHEQCRQRYPQFDLPNEYSGVFEPNAGFLIPERAVAAFAEQALHHGAELHGFEPVIEWSSDPRGATVRTSRSVYQSDRIIFCGGAWSERLLGDVGVNLIVTRQVLGWVWPREPALFELNTLPVWAIDHPDGTQHYGFPMLPAGSHGRPGFKIAHHFHGAPTTADTINRLPQPGDEEDFRWALRQFIPKADGQLLSMAVCMYTNSPDSHFIVDHHPRHDRVLIACGFSGHGFKFAGVIGEALADLAMNGRSDLPIGFLGLHRFAK